MNDVENYIKKRSKNNSNFEAMVEKEYENLKLGYIIKELREKENMTQDELALKLQTTKSAISRLENHTENIRIITLERIAEVFNKKLHISIQ
ncbi:MAG: transcriptional regulator [Spirochaetes bacterium GWF1_31_7]|nr:MAG: transcriptional regulator [Spirochaetes bacterium GWE2_31_10]OHD51134.1 MAG: transcriptional regulator [Spirochaetes bacterium GWF1_31_7]OHD80027.1 MAG: transcriptional regulator [Spirochaetes bacterium RIFOXYB1_FULL_32_8]HBD95032.1 transcriptional regulator [Spirochaetia bacterium]HBI38981.1 transcriptional regulator [Spirochaetia bacterium]